VPRLLVAVFLAALTASLGLPAASAATGPAHGEAGQPSVLLWGSGVFFGRSAFERWLRRHHQSYDTWESLHPVGRRILRAAGAKPVQFRRDQIAPSRAARIAEPLILTTPDTGGSTLVPALLAFAALLTAASAVPLARLAPLSARAALFDRSRIGMSAAGLGLLVGVIVAKLV
jgi:hypothetical protein